MHKLARYSIFPLLLLNSTISANYWSFMGLALGRPFYWLAILLAACVLFYSCYRKLALLLMLAVLFCQFLEIYPSSELIVSNAIIFRKLFIAILFIASSAVIYSENPRLLSRQLGFFLVLCLPFMILQLTGAHYLFLSWNTHRYGPPLAFEDIGKFKEIVTYPTLFVPYEELYYQVKQGRPVGLLFSNNLLSVVIVCALVFNLYWRRHANITLTDIALHMVAMLSLSKLVILFTFILYSFACMSREAKFRTVARQNLFIFVNCIMAYFIFFPGMFFRHFDFIVYAQSFLFRLVDIAGRINLGFLGTLIQDIASYYNINIDPSTIYTGVAELLEYNFLWPMLALFLLFYFSIRKKLHIFIYFSRQNQEFYNLLYLAAFISLVPMPFLQTPLIQFIFGIGCLPFLAKFWRRRIDRIHPSI